MDKAEYNISRIKNKVEELDNKNNKYEKLRIKYQSLDVHNYMK